MLRNVDDRSSIHRLTRLPVVVDIVIDINVLFLGGVRESERERLEEMVLGSVRESERPRVSLEEMIEVHLAPWREAEVKATTAERRTSSFEVCLWNEGCQSTIVLGVFSLTLTLLSLSLTHPLCFHFARETVSARCLLTWPKTGP